MELFLCFFKRTKTMPTEKKHAEVEELKKDSDIRRALEQTAGNKKMTIPKVETKHKFWLGTYLLLLLGFGSVYYLLRLRFFDFAAVYLPPLQRAAMGAMAIVLVLMISKAVKIYLINRLDDTVARFNLSESSICSRGRHFLYSFSILLPIGIRRLSPRLIR